MRAHLVVVLGGQHRRIKNHSGYQIRVFDSQPAGQVGTVRRAVHHCSIDFLLVEYSCDIVDDGRNRHCCAWKIPSASVVTGQPDSSMFDHDGVDPALGRARSEASVGENRGQAWSSGENDDGPGRRRTGSGVREIELRTVGRRLAAEPTKPGTCRCKPAQLFLFVCHRTDSANKPAKCCVSSLLPRSMVIGDPGVNASRVRPTVNAIAVPAASSIVSGAMKPSSAK